MIDPVDPTTDPESADVPGPKKLRSERFLRYAVGVSLATHLLLFTAVPRLLPHKKDDAQESVEDLAVVNVETAPPSDAALAADVKLRETASAPVKESAPKPPPVPVAPKSLVKWSPPPPPRHRRMREEEPRKTPVFHPRQVPRRMIAQIPVKAEVKPVAAPERKPQSRPINVPQPPVAAHPVAPAPAPVTPAPRPHPAAVDPRPVSPTPAPRPVEAPKPQPPPRRDRIALRPSDVNLRGNSGGGGGGNEGRQPAPNPSPTAPVSAPPSHDGGNASPNLGSPSGNGPSGSGAGSSGGHEGGRSEGSGGGSGGGKGGGNGSGEGSGNGPGSNGGSGGGEDGGNGRRKGHRRGSDRNEDNHDKGSGGGHDESFHSRLADRQEPELTRDAAPDYPDSAREDGVSGSVTLSYTVNGEGHVEDVRVTRSSGDDRLDRAATSAARRWRYKPAVQDGQPRSVKWRRTLRFDLQ